MEWASSRKNILTRQDEGRTISWAQWVRPHVQKMVTLSWGKDSDVPSGGDLVIAIESKGKVSPVEPIFVEENIVWMKGDHVIIGFSRIKDEDGTVTRYFIRGDKGNRKRLPYRR